MRTPEQKRLYWNNWYEKNKKTYVKSQYQRQKARRHGIREFLFKYKSEHPCCRCGFSHPAALQFHHRDPEKKVAEIGHAHRGIDWSMDKLMVEIEKCDVLCANCHFIHHHEIK